MPRKTMLFAAAAATVCILAVTAGQARAQTALYSCLAPSNNYYAADSSFGDIAQTFTVAGGGQVEGVRFDWAKEDVGGTTTADANVSLTAAGPTGPTGPPLATAPLDLTTAPTWPTFASKTVTFPSPVTIAAGQSYAIVWSHPTGAGWLDVPSNDSDVCPGGQGWFDGPSTWDGSNLDDLVTVQVLGEPPKAAAAKNSTKCKRLRKKLKRQKKALAREATEEKRAKVAENIEDTKERLRRLGC